MLMSTNTKLQEGEKPVTLFQTVLFFPLIFIVYPISLYYLQIRLPPQPSTG